MARTIEITATISSGLTYITGSNGSVQVPDAPLNGVHFIHPALASTTTTLEVARPDDAAFATAYSVLEPSDTTPTKVTISDALNATSEDLTDYLRGLGGCFVRWAQTGAASTLNTCYWRFSLLE
jgi:hypothetical protein